MRRAQLGQLRERGGRKVVLSFVRIGQRRCPRDRLELARECRAIETYGRGVEHPRAGFQDRTIAGAAAEVDGERSPRLPGSRARAFRLVLE
jgi:hypothetical protein